MGVYSSLEVYPAYFDELYDCSNDDCNTCTFDCWKNYSEENEEDLYDEYYSCYEVII